jgi:hypothetical protein
MNILLGEQNVHEKDKIVPRCRRRKQLSDLAQGRNKPHRVSRVNLDTSAHFASETGNIQDIP